MSPNFFWFKYQNFLNSLTLLSACNSTISGPCILFFGAPLILELAAPAAAYLISFNAFLFNWFISLMNVSFWLCTGNFFSAFAAVGTALLGPPPNERLSEAPAPYIEFLAESEPMMADVAFTSLSCCSLLDFMPRLRIGRALTSCIELSRSRSSCAPLIPEPSRSRYDSGWLISSIEFYVIC